jgi:hypothetical protein
VVQHPPYSPHLFTAALSLLPKLKVTLKGRRFGSVEERQAETPKQLNTFLQTRNWSAVKKAVVVMIVLFIQAVAVS